MRSLSSAVVGAAWVAALPIVTLALSSCVTPGSPAPGRASPPAGYVASIQPPSVADLSPRSYQGIHNVVAYRDGFISGSAPEGDEGFQTLSAMGVRTIISVDGAEPEVARAAAHGIRYIHLPIGYDGFDEERKLQLIRAVRDAVKDSPVYIHCHHGKHRSAGAAATVAVSLGWLDPQAGVRRMHVSGTAPQYSGLYACAASAVVLASSTVDAVPAGFPSVWKPSGFVKGMVEIDGIYEHLMAIERTGWVAPADHPDLVPVAEAGRLADLFRLAGQTEYASRRPAEFGTMLEEAQAAAEALEDLLATGAADTAKLSTRFQLVAASCRDCHAKYRDQDGNKGVRE
ncbi:MAG: hypothetical protein C4547_09060 [Phycisphaerales bacterium]|nr:MAG: hypothetical protein C4547_09060 [Phycisphaerales bacterium]